MKKGLFSLAFFAACALSASPLFFRGGEITGAEMSVAEPKIEAFDAELFPDLPENRIYAALKLSLPEGRKISIFDYRLSAFGVEYPCVALKSGASMWRTTPETLENVREVALLFVLNRGMTGLDKKEKLLLQCAAPATRRDVQGCEIVFLNLGDKSFSF